MARPTPSKRTLEREEKAVEEHGFMGTGAATVAGAIVGGAVGALPAAIAGRALTGNARKRVARANAAIETAKPKIAAARAEVVRLRKQKGK